MGIVHRTDFSSFKNDKDLSIITEIDFSDSFKIPKRCVYALEILMAGLENEK
jgi:hypothetical protein